MMQKILLAVLLVGSAVVYALYSQKNLEGQVADGGDLLRKMPQVMFVGLDGTSVGPGTMVGADVVLVHFWATWCGPCEAELPELFRFLARLPSRGKVRVLLVAVNDELPKIRKFIQTLPIPNGARVEWVLDDAQTHREAFGTTKLPETYAFSGDGRLLRKLVGPQEWGKPLFFDMFGAWTR